MAKKRTLNEYRQTKEYQGSSEGWKYLNDLENTKKKKLEKIEKAHKIPEEIKKIQKELEANNLDPMESAKEMIANKIIKQFDDWVFEMVSEEMSKHYMFREDNYLTEAGMDAFQDIWFEFYQEHHGDILYQVKKNLFE